MINQLRFLKLGGSLLTDKTGVEQTRPQVIGRIAQEIAQARQQQPDLALLLGHGSGSFGHVAAAKYGTRQGVYTTEQWFGFAEVSAAAARLNKIITDALVLAGVPAISFQPSASALCANGLLESLAIKSILRALRNGLVPLVYGDVAFDLVRGGTIISTEEIFSYLVADCPPTWLLLAGETDGVYDLQGDTIPLITPANFADIREALGGSRGTDVTGGMAGKVREMLDLVQDQPALSICIFSGLIPGNISQALLDPTTVRGTILHHDTIA
ncbi:MAG: isopentenyl phosphate kinase family protein [Chloroflexi bacterium]|nr:isopentenyl phosphate kinase family protein [Chloroflexota bacterium]MBP8057731.1 isopentenyl phosphate kinase family protein [Chloroflexota bacterium]